MIQLNRIWNEMTGHAVTTMISHIASLRVFSVGAAALRIGYDLTESQAVFTRSGSNMDKHLKRFILVPKA